MIIRPQRVVSDPGHFSITFARSGCRSHRLTVRQVLALPPAAVFPFFEDPRNLFAITPGWLSFRMTDAQRHRVFEGAEFSYTIRWLGIRLPWRSRIEEYRPPHSFTDVQIVGPYRSWRHSHAFIPEGDGTLMIDDVHYTLPCLGVLLHPVVIRRQLDAIFSYRFRKINELVAAGSV